MELAGLIKALSQTAAYPFPLEKVEVRHTHISVVFLAGPHAYKIKKPVDLGFLDFTTLAKRRHYCEEEIRLNRRLAPAVYLEVVPVTRSGREIKLQGDGEVVEWAVKMERLPAEATLLKRFERGEVSAELLTALASKIASFHAHAEAGAHISEFGRFEVVARNARENFEQAQAQVGTTVCPGVFERLRRLNEQALVRLQPLIEGRARRGVPRDTHGDLHLDHVYLFGGDRQPPADLVIIDCIEFNERFRFADPVADMAFLVMDLKFQGGRDLAGAFADAYFRASGDEEGRGLLSFYTAYRAAIRGKVEGMELGETEVPEAERTAARTKARAHWLLALGELDEPGRRPCLVLVGGLPGAGKSTLARGLAEHAGFTVIRSDVVRKELAHLSGQEAAPSSFGEGIYAPEWTERTYVECLERAEKLLFAGHRVVVDASFGDDDRRRKFLEVAVRFGAHGVFLLCHADPEVALLRLGSRRGDVSDADWSVYRQAADRWQEPGPITRRAMRKVSTYARPEEALALGMQVLREFNLQD